MNDKPEERLCPTCGDVNLVLTWDEPIDGWTELACKSCHRVLEIGRPGVGPLVDPLWVDRPSPELRCPGVGRDAENQKALCFYFNRPVSDDEMRFLHEVMQRAVAISRGPAVTPANRGSD